jgi:hypothetical protein
MALSPNPDPFQDLEAHLAPPIPEGTKPRLSASQIGTFLDCPRKWAWRYLAGIKEPDRTATVLGSAVHKVLEDYLLRGDLPTHYPLTIEGKNYVPGAIAAAGLDFLPTPGEALVESEIRFETLNASWVGYVDALLTGEDPVIFDHKTTSDFKWSKTPTDLFHDTQANLYAFWFLHHGPGSSPKAEDVSCQWTYFKTRGTPTAKAVAAVLTRQSTAEKMAELDSVAGEIAALARAPKHPLKVHHHPSACEKFGGCFYRSRCGLSAAERFESMDIRELIARKQAEAQATTLSPPPLPVAAPVPPPLPPEARPRGPEHWVPGDPLNQAQAYAQAQGASLEDLAKLATKPPPGLTERGLINPPEAPLLAPAEPSEMPPVGVDEDLDEDQEDPVFAQVVATPAKKRGRPSKAETLEKQAVANQILNAKRFSGLSDKDPIPAPGLPVSPKLAESIAQALADVERVESQQGLPPTAARSVDLVAKIDQPVSVPAIPTLPEQIEAARAETQALEIMATAASVVRPLVTGAPEKVPGQLVLDEGLTLYVNCIPVRGCEAVPLALWLAPIFERMREGTGLPDYRLEDFGKGSARLCAGVAETLEKEKPQAIYVDSRTTEGRDVLPVLERYATRVIRGI